MQFFMENKVRRVGNPPYGLWPWGISLQPQLGCDLAHGLDDVAHVLPQLDQTLAQIYADTGYLRRQLPLLEQQHLSIYR